MEEHEVKVGQKYLQENEAGVYEVLHIVRDTVVVLWRVGDQERDLYTFSKSTNMIFDESNLVKEKEPEQPHDFKENK